MVKLNKADSIFYRDLRGHVLPFYKGNDKAHQIDHAEQVVHLALEMNQNLSLDLCRQEVIAAGLLHDIRNDDRENHHTLAKEYIMANIEALPFSQWDADKVFRVANACAEHRASYKGTYSSLLSEVISSADRGKPDFERYWKRCLKTSICEGLPESGKPAVIIAHMKEKIGTGGYARYPDIYKTYFKDELKTLTALVDAL